MIVVRRLASLLSCVPLLLGAQGAKGAPKVGPAKGTVIVVGGGSMGPEVYKAFIDAAGGPDALILTVPNAGGAESYPAEGANTRSWKQNGAHNVQVLFTTDRKVADSDAFVALIKKAGGIWFEGGRQFHLVDAYAGTKTEAAFNEVLVRGGVVGGSSAGASILGDFLVRGAPSNNNFIMDHPAYQKGFAYLRGVGIDQHVVARERLPDLADSIIPKYPALLAISEDEGTAWVVRGDTGTIVGRNRGFVYNGKDANDPGTPFLTLHPGDRYDLGARRVLHRVASESPVSPALVKSLFAKYEKAAAGGATVLVAKDGKVFVDQSFGIPPQARYMPTTTVPNFPLGRISAVFEAICAQVPEPAGRGRAGGTAPADSSAGRGRAAAPPQTPFQRCVSARASTPVGLHKTTATESGEVLSNVDELYRLALGLEQPRTYTRGAATGADSSATRDPIDATQGWSRESVGGVTRYAAYAIDTGKRAAFVRVPDRHATVIVLTNDAAADAKGMADALMTKLLAAR